MFKWDVFPNVIQKSIITHRKKSIERIKQFPNKFRRALIIWCWSGGPNTQTTCRQSTSLKLTTMEAVWQEVISSMASFNRSTNTRTCRLLSTLRVIRLWALFHPLNVCRNQMAFQQTLCKIWRILEATPLVISQCQVLRRHLSPPQIWLCFSKHVARTTQWYRTKVIPRTAEETTVLR
jgi:hypothetical protein